MQSDKLRYCGCCHRGNMPLPLIAAVWANTMFPTPDPHGLAVVAAPLYPSSHCIVFCCRLSVCHSVSINISLSRILSDTWGHYPTLHPIFARRLISRLDYSAHFVSFAIAISLIWQSISHQDSDKICSNYTKSQNNIRWNGIFYLYFFWFQYYAFLDILLVLLPQY